MDIRLLSLLLPIILFGTCWGQNEDEECGGPIKCSVGTACQVSTSKGSGGSSQYPSTKIEDEGLKDCTENAECLEGICRCTSGFMSTSYGHCLPTFNSSCDQTQCNEEAHLICSPETHLCICPFTDSQFSEAAGTCLGSLGASCSSSSMECTENAFCNFMFDWKCHCNGGFTPTADDRCLPSFGSPCQDGNGSSSNCNPDEFLTCLNQQCVCQDGTVRDEDEGRCLSLVGGRCDLKVTGDMFRLSSCIQGASCKPSSTDPIDTRSGTCQCPSGREETERKICASNALRFISPGVVVIFFLSIFNVGVIS